MPRAASRLPVLGVAGFWVVGFWVVGLWAAGAVGLAAPAAASAETGAGERLCELADPRLSEVSGLAAAEGVWWVHNDSGDPGARLFALDRACRTLAVVTLRGVDARDAEDLAVTRGPDGRAVAWLADIGDNRASRPEVRLLRAVLPGPADLGATGAPARLVVDATVTRLVHVGGPRDAESLLVDPSGAFAVVTKPLLGPPEVLVAPTPAAPDDSGGVQLQRAGDVRLGRPPAGVPVAGPAGPLSSWLVTGGAVASDGDRVALRTYTHVHEWHVRSEERRAGGGLDFPALLGREPDVVALLPTSEQGEAVAYDEDGATLLLTGEGSGAPVHRVRTPPVAAPSAPAGGGAAAASSDGELPSERRVVPVLAGAAAAVGAAAGALRYRRNRRVARALTG